jgi:heptosyltransferase-3
VSTILIMRPGAIGDSLLAFPILRVLRRQYTNPHIIFASNAAVLPLALDSGLADEACDYGDLQWRTLFSASGIPNLSERYSFRTVDLAVCWLRDPDGIVQHNLLNAGVKQVIVAPGRPLEGQRIHIVDYLAETVGIKDIEKDICLLRRSGMHFAPPQQAKFLLNAIAIHPGSGGARKCWPVEHFAEVLKRLWQRGCPILLLAGPADSERLYSLQQIISPPTPDHLTTLENAPLLEVAQQLGHCVCYLGNDSGITHLAAMLGLPTLALFGPSDPVIWKPVGPQVEVIWEPNLEQLDIGVVMEHLS